MSPTTANFLFEATNFLLLAAALTWLLFKPVRRVLDEERARHLEAEKSAERARAEAEASLKEARAAREGAARDVEERRREIVAAAEKQAARILEETREAQAAARRGFEQELAASRRTEGAALAETVGRIAAEAVRRLLTSIDGPALDRALVGAAATELRTLPASARASAVVESARPLESETKRLLEDVLGASFETRTLAELGAGVRVTTSGGQVDASALSIARQAAAAVTGARPRAGEERLRA